MVALQRDENRVVVLAGVTDDANLTVTPIKVDPATGRIKCVATISNLTVSGGGTGVTSFTPYAIITGGTTATGALQQVASLGTSGQVLTSSGAGALPTWTTIAGTGSVTSVSVVSANGFAGTVATATSTPAITLTTTITGILSGNGTAISAASTTGSGSVVLATSPTITTPTIAAITVSGGTMTLPTGSTDTLVGKATTDTFTNKTYDTAGAGNVFRISGTAISSVTGTGSAVLATGPTVTSPRLVTSLLDTNGNILVNIGATASAVNYVKITNAATGTAGAIVAADGETNVDLRIAGKGTGKVHCTTGSYGDLTSNSDGVTITFNLATSNIHTVTLGGNRTLALSNASAGQCFILRLVQDATGSRTVTWFTTIKWAGGSAPTLTTTANKTDVFGFLVTSAGNYDGFIIGQNL